MEHFAWRKEEDPGQADAVDAVKARMAAANFMVAVGVGVEVCQLYSI
jgi:hypothetical protein